MNKPNVTSLRGPVRVRELFFSLITRLLALPLSSPTVVQTCYSFFDVRRLQACLTKLLAMGLKIDIVYDVGAREGSWSLAISKTLRGAEFILFEATARCVPKLEKTGFQYFICVLSSEEKKVLFYEIGGTGDSYYRENTTLYDAAKPSERQATTLESLIRINNLPLPAFIKLDTQGSELDILKGGHLALSRASLVYMECPLVNYNQGAPGIKDYLGFMRDNDFVPYEVCEQHFVFGALVQIDILFIRKPVISTLLNMTEDILHS